MNDAGSQIGFERLGIGSVLSRYQLAVPPNQREYSWTDKEVTRLFDDFARAISDSDPSYFLGTIVAIPHGEGRLQIVDGQQRLATTAILLAAIRDYLKTHDEMIANYITRILYTIDRARRVFVPRLSLNVDDNEYFRTLITDGPPTSPHNVHSRPSHGLLLEAFRTAAERVQHIVAGHNPNDHGDVLNRWLSFIEHRAMVVLLTVPNSADAYRMFETLNDRGLRTTQADLVKNHLFSRAGDRMVEVQQKWGAMRAALETVEDSEITVDFLRHALIIMCGYTKESEIYGKVQELTRGEQAAVHLVSRLESLSQFYVAIYNAAHENWNALSSSTRRAVEALNLLDVGPARPLMLSVANRIQGDELRTTMDLLVAVCVRLLLARRTRSGTVEHGLAVAANRVFEGHIQSASELASELKTITPPDDMFREVVKAATVANAKYARYYLRSMEMTARGERQPWLIPNDDRMAINLEHVLPLKGGESWPDFDQESAEAYRHRLGNLALLQVSSNVNLGYKLFDEKREIYRAAPYVLTAQIAEAPSWTREAIKNRQVTLAELAVKTWRM